MRTCPYCNTEVEGSKKYGAHIRNCPSNPKREAILEKLRKGIGERTQRLFPVILDKCPGCGTDFETPSQPRLRKKFCSRKCANSRTNSGPEPKNLLGWCLCGKSIPKHKKFCDTKCYRLRPKKNPKPKKAVTQEQERQARFHRGEIAQRATLKRYLLKIKAECFECGLTEWRGHKLPLEVHHIDGDASNNLPSNLQLVCANCHSVTPSWKGKNAGSGRKSRGLRQE